MQHNRFTKKIGLILIISTIILIAFSESAVLANGALPPKPITPKGTITDTTPTFKWSKVKNATKYKLQVLDKGQIVLAKVIGTPDCTWNKCTFTFSTRLFHLVYKWRIQAYVDGVWTAFSAKKKFTIVQPPAFESLFEGNSDGWTAHKGVWTVKNGTYFTKGSVNRIASASHEGDYSDYTYTVRIKRSGCSDCGTALLVRGDPSSVDQHGYWYDQFALVYNNDGEYGASKVVNGGFTPIQGYTYTSAINQGGWNILKVIDSGHQIKFYINDTKVWQTIDSSLIFGRVGVGMFKTYGSVGDKVWVDWATLVPSN